ncbi:hypothetical protein [Devosia sp. 919]|uniref:hypothetical protein n=1 Tax=Devosia sp. 919 TaxID=2726065 RepID=UPI00155472E4|nr:hypothetical protein [Devosia sp. 919]
MSDADLLFAAVRAANDFASIGLDQERLLSVVRQASDGPEASALFLWLCVQGSHAPAATAAVEFVSTTRDPATVADIVDHLIPTALGEDLRRALWTVFIARAEDKRSGYGLRGQALHGALLLAQDNKGLLFRLKGSLADLSLQDDPHFLRHAARILGVVLAHSPESDFREKLVSLVDVDEASDEAAMELGLDALRRGLDSTTSESAGLAFEEGAVWFRKATAASEDRADARLYFKCTEILLSVHRNGFDGNLSVGIPELVEAAFRYSALLGEEENSKPSWLGSQTSERLHWTLLASKLGTLDATLNKKVWMNVARVVEDELLALYRSSRSILMTGKDGGLDLIVRPEISAALYTHRRHLDGLDQWIEENEGMPDLPDAVAMRAAVDRAKEASLLHRPFDAGSVGRELTAILDAGQVPMEARSGIAERLEAAVRDLSADENPIVGKVVEDILSDMVRNPHYSGFANARSLFTAVLIISVYFLLHRHETGLSSDPDAEYLFVRSPKTLPLENAIQRDYFRFLRSSSIRDHVSMEVRDTGAGRADVYFSARGLSTVTEVKRSLVNRDLPGLLNEYGLQTAAYQTTTVSFAFLLVLDLFDRSRGLQPHLEKQISLGSKTPSGQDTAYDVVVMRVQGQRKVPSEMGK